MIELHTKCKGELDFNLGLDVYTNKKCTKMVQKCV